MLMSFWKRFCHLLKKNSTKIGRTNHSKSCSLEVAKDNNNNLNSNNALEAPAVAQPPKSLTSSSSGREVDNITQEQNDVQFTPLQEELKYADMVDKVMLKWKKNIFHSSQRQIRKRFYKRDDQADRRMEL